MFILLASTAAEGSKLKFAAALAIALIVAAGAAVRTFNSLKDKKFASSSLESIVNSIYKDPEIINLLKSVITDKCFQDSNNYEEFIHNVHTEARDIIYSYIQKNITFIPVALRPLVTVDNMEHIAEGLLGLAGYDGKELTDMFEKYLDNLLTTEGEVETDTIEEEINEENDAEPVIETNSKSDVAAVVSADGYSTSEVVTEEPANEDYQTLREDNKYAQEGDVTSPIEQDQTETLAPAEDEDAHVSDSTTEEAIEEAVEPAGDACEPSPEVSVEATDDEVKTEE